MVKAAAIFALVLGLSFGYMNMENDMAFPRGIRLHNPGNIKRTDIHWRGMTRLQDDKTFIRFESPYYGIRALIKLLVNYKSIHDLSSITTIIHRYAPTSENNTNAYIRDVSARSGYFPNEVLDMNDEETLVRLAAAIVVHENGLPPVTMPYLAWYAEEVYYQAASDVLEGG